MWLQIHNYNCVRRSRKHRTVYLRTARL